MVGWASTGYPNLDSVLNGINKGDNIVWQVDNIDDFRKFVQPYVKQALKDNRKIIYMRFANHPRLVEPAPGIKTYELDAKTGFETFSARVHSIIAKEGLEAHYVFDSLSDLLIAWATDLMIGNFFRITCPFLFELDTIAYFAILRNFHSFKTIARIRETTQLLLDLYHFEDDYYVHPLKVWNRYSPTMFLPYQMKNDKFVPITSSVDATKLISYISSQGLEPAQRSLDHWDRLFLEAETIMDDQSTTDPQARKIVGQLCEILIGREERILNLARNNFTLRDILDIKKRLIGTGYIGGKAVGMLLANNLISKDKSLNLVHRLEPHDSYYVGSDVFYTYIVENGWWKLRVEQKTPQGYFQTASELKKKLLSGKFPDQVREQFQEMLEYFGQSPIIVRSSSLLEDAFGNAFAGKYESLFCVNQGSPEERYSKFIDAVKTIYASTMNEDALTYRLQRGLDQQDEQMALLIQRVSGSYHKHYFFPDLAGVGMSHNTFVWKKELDPQAGMLRLVAGLGTRAVNRVEDDYPRIIALDAPLLRPHSGLDDLRKFSQHRLDILDVQNTIFATEDLNKLVGEGLDLKLNLIGIPDIQMTKRARKYNISKDQYWLLTFEKLLMDTDFVEMMQKILQTLQKKYEYPVDIEFTVNFTADNQPMVNLLQCRPLQTRGRQIKVDIPENVRQENILFKCEGYFMGGSICEKITRLIYVDPAGYEKLQQTEKYDIARLVGKINKLIDRNEQRTILLGPGRWGTTTPSLGVPVSFSEINNITVLGEIAYEGGNLMPELSFGTHFFQDLVEGDIFYLALFPRFENVIFNNKLCETMPNKIHELMPAGAKYADVVRVFDFENSNLQLIADILSQKLICFFK